MCVVFVAHKGLSTKVNRYSTSDHEKKTEGCVRVYLCEWTGELIWGERKEKEINEMMSKVATLWLTLCAEVRRWNNLKSIHGQNIQSITYPHLTVACAHHFWLSESFAILEKPCWHTAAMGEFAFKAFMSFSSPCVFFYIMENQYFIL